MITKFKIFEKDTIYIYTCPDFKVREDFGFESMFIASDITRQLPSLIIDKHYALNDENLKNLKITNEYKRKFSLHELPLYDTKIKNLKEYKSGLISYFLYKNKREDLEKIDPEVYIKLIFKYYPIIGEIIENSNTIGDVIVEYEILIPKINEDLVFFTEINKYNL